jgi:DNA-directed RNA polymerase subunit beta'
MFDHEIGFQVGKKQLGNIIDRCIKKYGFTISAEVLDNIKAMGYKYSTKSALTISIFDMTVPDAKKSLIEKAEQQVLNIERQYKRGFITDDERYRLVVSQWEQTTKDVTNALQDCLDEYNPIYMMANSGARGSMAQIRQLAGMRGLIANTSGKTIEIPIKANYREGLTVLEYFVSSRGARKGLADTALRTADSGYLTRRMVDVSQDVIIREEDCGTTEGVMASAVYDRGQVVQSFGVSIHGRYPAEPITDPKTGEVIFDTTICSRRATPQSWRHDIHRPMSAACSAARPRAACAPGATASTWLWASPSTPARLSASSRLSPSASPAPS